MELRVEHWLDMVMWSALRGDGGIVLSIRGCFNTPLEHTPKPLPTGHKGILFIVG